MAVVLMEGFDHLVAGDVTLKGWGSNPATMVAGRFDGQAARLNGNTNTNKALPSTYTTLICGLAFKLTTAASSGNFFAIRTAAAGNILTLNTDASGHLVVKNNGGTTIATGTTVLVAGSWYYLEVKLFINTGTPASGTVEVHLNGATEIASTAGNFGSTAAGNLLLGTTGTSSAADQVSWDDIYVLDTTGSAPRNTFLGDVRIETIYPNGAGNYTQWTPDSGSNYARVNEAQADGDTSYVSDSTVGHRDSYAFGNIDAGATVYGVQTNLYARKDDAATRQVAPFIRQSSTDYDGTTVTLGSNYTVYSQLYNQDPTSADWTPTTVNADEFGIKEIA